MNQREQRERQNNVTEPVCPDYEDIVEHAGKYTPKAKE